MKIQLVYIYTVSYTHLDVYKRQVLYHVGLQSVSEDHCVTVLNYSEISGVCHKVGYLWIEVRPQERNHVQIGN